MKPKKYYIFTFDIRYNKSKKLTHDTIKVDISLFSETLRYLKEEGAININHYTE